MSTLKQLNLTEKDFDLLVEGLETLPNKDKASELVGSLLEGMFLRGDDDAQREFKLKRELEARKKEEDGKLLKEDIKILQGKLLILKRYLIQNEAII